MFLPAPLPRTIFEEIGKVVVIWATIEQDIILQTSAMAAQKTDGKPTDYLRMDFRRLREKWFSLCREYFDTTTFNKIVNPLNVELCRLSEQRGLIVHGRWTKRSRGQFQLNCFEQKSNLVHYETDVSLATLRTIRHDSYLLSKRVHRFTAGDPSFKDGKLPVLKEIGPVSPDH